MSVRNKSLELSHFYTNFSWMTNNHSPVCPISRCLATWTLSSGPETSGSCSKRLAGIRAEWHDTRHRLLKSTPPPSTSNPTTSKTTTRVPSTNQEQASEEPGDLANQTTARWGVTPQVDPHPTNHTLFYLPITSLGHNAGTNSKNNFRRYVSWVKITHRFVFNSSKGISEVWRLTFGEMFP